MKKISILVASILLLSCTNQQSTTQPQPINVTPQQTSFSVLILGKWSYSSSSCGKNFIVFGQSGIYSENKYNPNCQLINYPGTYSITNNVIKIDNYDFIIVSIETDKLVLKDPWNNIQTYTKII